MIEIYNDATRTNFMNVDVIIRAKFVNLLILVKRLNENGQFLKLERKK